jgi:hypothetical protein
MAATELVPKAGRFPSWTFPAEGEIRPRRRRPSVGDARCFRPASWRRYDSIELSRTFCSSSKLVVSKSDRFMLFELYSCDRNKKEHEMKEPLVHCIFKASRSLFIYPSTCRLTLSICILESYALSFSARCKSSLSRADSLRTRSSSMSSAN